MNINDVIADGTSKFKVVSKSMLHWFDIIYPVGSVYATTKKGKPFELGKWELVGQDGTLWGVGEDEEAGQKKAAGLPNATGSFATFNWWDKSGDGETADYGVIRRRYNNTTKASTVADNSGGKGFFNTFIDVNLSGGNSIYGNSDTVQPPAYTVYFWHRIA